MLKHVHTQHMHTHTHARARAHTHTHTQIQDAAAALATQLKPLLQAAPKTSKGFASSSKPQRALLGAEIPIIDQSPGPSAQLVSKVVGQLITASKVQPSAVVVAFADASTKVEAERSRSSGGKQAGALPFSARLMDLRTACREQGMEGSILVIANPKIADVGGLRLFWVDSNLYI